MFDKEEACMHGLLLAINIWKGLGDNEPTGFSDSSLEQTSTS
jgi:hypothetical protein